MYRVNLVRHVAGSNEIYTDSFSAVDNVENAEDAIRSAVNKFLLTSTGKKIIEQKNGKFDWSDAVVYVPCEIWNRYGLYPVQSDNTVNISVDQHEILSAKKPKETTV